MEEQRNPMPLIGEKAAADYQCLDWFLFLKKCPHKLGN